MAGYIHPARPLAIVLNRRDFTWVPTALVWLSIRSSLRYFYWCLTATVGIGGPGITSLDLFFTFGLLAAEAYALFVILMGHFQTVQPLRRRPVRLPADPSLWPGVDVFIPTYDEPLSVVQPTLFAAMDMD